MQPARAGKRAFPVDVAFFRLRDGGAGPVINDHGGSLIGAALEEVDPQAASLSNDCRRVYSMPGELGDARVAYRVRGYDGDVGRVQAEARQGHGDVRLASAEGRLEARALEEAFRTRRLETQHDFTEGDVSRHAHLLSFLTSAEGGRRIRRSRRRGKSR